MEILVFLAVWALLWLWPVLTIVNSSKVTGSEKVAWILAVIFFGWIAFVFYWLLAPLKRKE